MLEGLAYFLSRECLQWLSSEMAAFQHSAIIVDYWLKEHVLESAVFRNSMHFCSDNIPETIEALFDTAWTQKLITPFSRHDHST